MNISMWVWRDSFSVVVVVVGVVVVVVRRFRLFFFFGPNGRQIRIQRIEISLHANCCAKRTLATPFSVTSSVLPLCTQLSLYNIEIKSNI